MLPFLVLYSFFPFPVKVCLSLSPVLFSSLAVGFAASVFPRRLPSCSQERPLPSSHFLPRLAAALLGADLLPRIVLLGILPKRGD